MKMMRRYITQQFLALACSMLVISSAVLVADHWIVHTAGAVGSCTFYSISGSVDDKSGANQANNNLPISATIYDNLGNIVQRISTTTNGSGKYTLCVTFPGQYTVSVDCSAVASFPGYYCDDPSPATRQVTVGPSCSTNGIVNYDGTSPSCVP